MKGLGNPEAGRRDSSPWPLGSQGDLSLDHPPHKRCRGKKTQGTATFPLTEPAGREATRFPTQQRKDPAQRAISTTSQSITEITHQEPTERTIEPFC